MYSLFEQDYKADTLLTFPELYLKHRDNILMSRSHFVHWLLCGQYKQMIFFLSTEIINACIKLSVINYGIESCDKKQFVYKYYLPYININYSSLQLMEIVYNDGIHVMNIPHFMIINTFIGL